MRSNEISDILLKEFYPKGRNYCTTNFTGCGLHECDVIMVTESYMVYEYEIKCSYQDFKADFKKQDKHNKLSGSYYKNPIVSPYKNIIHDEQWYLKHTGTTGRPNYFYYVSEPKVIPLDQIPEYAGLIHIIDNKPQIIKKAKKLHKYKCTFELISQICRNLTARMIYGCSFMNYKSIHAFRIKNP